MRFIRMSGLIVLLISGLYGTTADTSNGLGLGYLNIISDSLGTPLYVDRIFVGNAPLKQPVPVINGIHEISYLPPEINKPYLKQKLPEAIKRVYVPEGDTVTVRLLYDSQTEEIRIIRKEKTIGGYVGTILIGMLLMLLWKLTG